MEYDKNPLTPHLQIYKWQISSLLSITHRITGVINAIAVSVICIWFLFVIYNEKILFENVLNSYLGKFISPKYYLYKNSDGERYFSIIFTDLSVNGINLSLPPFPPKNF